MYFVRAGDVGRCVPTKFYLNFYLVQLRPYILKYFSIVYSKFKKIVQHNIDSNTSAMYIR